MCSEILKGHKEEKIGGGGAIYLVVLWISGELKSKVLLSTRLWLDSSVTKLLRNLLSFVSI